MIDASSPAADNDSYHSFDLRFQAHFFSSMSVFWCLNQVSVKKKKCSGKHLFGKWLNWRICDLFLLASITIGFWYWVVVATWCCSGYSFVFIFLVKNGINFFGIWTLFPCFIWYKGLYKEYVLFERLCGNFVWGLQTIFVRVSWVTLKVGKKMGHLVCSCVLLCMSWPVRDRTKFWQQGAFLTITKPHTWLPLHTIALSHTLTGSHSSCLSLSQPIMPCRVQLELSDTLMEALSHSL